MALALRPHPAVERLCGTSSNATRPPQPAPVLTPRSSVVPPNFHLPRLSSRLLPLSVVDIAPAVGAISPEFREYLTAMKEIEAAGVKSRKEADAILQKYEKARYQQLSFTNPT